MSSKNYIQIVDDHPGYPIELLSVPLHYRDDLESVLIPHGLISDRTETIANQIINDYDEKPLICFCMLKGGYKFFAHLIEKIQCRNRNTTKRSLPIIINFLKIDSSGKLDYELEDDLIQVKGKNVLLIDNIIKSGQSFQNLIKTINSYEPSSIKCCSLLMKRVPNEDDRFVPDYVGFEIPNRLVVGYALDLNEHFRDLEHICSIKEASISKFSR